MSRNFEILQRAEKNQQLGKHPSPVKPSSNEHGRSKLAGRAEEEARKLVQGVFFSNSKEGPRMVVFSGVEHGDRCSSICAHAAETLAAHDAGPVCVVDANLRTPSLHGYFGLENRTGLADAIQGREPIRNFTQPAEGSNLWILTSGSPADANALLTSEALPELLKELREQFAYVLIDAPPVNRYADAARLGQLADGVVLVLQARATHRDTARKAKEAFETAGGRVLGAVLNKRTYPIPQALDDRL